MFKLDKWSLLAGLRFALASIVACTHLAVFTPLGWLAFVPKFGAFEAILGFLLVSGYSVTVSYLKEPQQFLWRRLKRIYPIYLASFALTVLVVTLARHQSLPSMGYLFWNLLLLNQLFTFNTFVDPAWSLSLEFWLYCLAPLLVVTRPRWTRVIVYVSFASYLLYTAARTVLHWPYFGGVGYGANLLLLAYGWVIGMRLARDPAEVPAALWDLRLIFALHIALGAGIQLMSHLKRHTFGLFLSEDILSFAMQAATLGGVYFLFARSVLGQPGRRPQKRSAILRFLGDISYPLYLINIPIYILLAKTGLRSASFYYLIALLAAAALYGSVDVYSKRRHLKIGAA